MTMDDNKLSQPPVQKVTHETFRFLSILAVVDRLKRVIITLSVWGWLPLGLANWMLRKEEVKETSKRQTAFKTSDPN